VRRKMAIGAVAATAALAGTLAIAKPLPGDVNRGHELAKTWCIGCHFVEAHEIAAKDTVPSFNAIAAMKSTTIPSLKAFLQTRHRDMPDWWLTRQQVDDVIAYIMSLRPTSS
jgi:mono/diheme cytochrome c family protein